MMNIALAAALTIKGGAFAGLVDADTSHFPFLSTKQRCFVCLVLFQALSDLCQKIILCLSAHPLHRDIKRVRDDLSFRRLF